MKRLFATARRLWRGLFGYPVLRPIDATYDAYWAARAFGRVVPLNSFQVARARFVLETARPNCSITDFGAGDGRTLAFLQANMALTDCLAVDRSPDALKAAAARGLPTFHVSTNDKTAWQSIPTADYVLLFEVLEHVSNAELLLSCAREKARCGVFFSVPNTGHIMHRLRLILGRFPLQWVANPSEHLRFWTVGDMHWWLRAQNLDRYTLRVYAGPPIVSRLLPNLMHRGISVFVPAEQRSP